MGVLIGRERKSGASDTESGQVADIKDGGETGGSSDKRIKI